MNTIEKSISLLLDDEKFMNNLKIDVNEILNDEKLDINDLIPIISIINNCLINHKKIFSIDEEDVAEVIRCLLIHILNESEFYNKIKLKLNLSDDEIDAKIDQIIENILKILLTHIKTSVFFKNIYTKFKKIICCSNIEKYKDVNSIRSKYKLNKDNKILSNKIVLDISNNDLN